jgi:HK97 gp10 family phage protein
MAKNASVERFRLLSEKLKNDVHVEAVRELYNQANNLKETIEQVAPVYTGPPLPGVEPGALKSTVNTVPDRRKDTIVRVVAGGKATTTSGVRPFDYSRAVEFGTVEMKAEPFFFPTYRLMKKRMIAAMKRRITATIKKYSAQQSGNV